MKLNFYGLLLLGSAAVSAGHSGLLRQTANTDAGFTTRLAGVRRCLGLHSGDEMEVLALKQRYGKDSFLVARPSGSPKLVAKAALHATYEAMLRGSGCAEAEDASSANWFLDVGTDDDELLALASSLGCGVAVLDPEVKDVRAVDMTRCMNEEPNRPFVVFQVTASNITNPETLANMTKPHEWVNMTVSDMGPNMTVSLHEEPHEETVSPHEEPHEESLIGLKKTWPTMLNKLRKKKKQAAKQKDSEESMPADVDQSSQEVAEKSSNRTEPAQVSITTPAPQPMENAVMLDTVFTKSEATNEAMEVAASDGRTVIVNKIALLKITPRSENDATLRALQGARNLIESGRVQCLTTEMNFDLNHTDSLLSFVTELEQKHSFQFAHLGSLDYSELEVTDKGQYEVFRTDSKQLSELFDTYKRIRSFDERSGFRVYSGSLSLDRKGHYFDYSDVIFACRNGFPEGLSLLEKGKIRFRNGVWWLEKMLTGL